MGSKLGLACGVFCAVVVATHRRLLALAIYGTMLALAGGCGGDSGPPRAVVSGTITYQGKPVETGEIRFIPTKGSKGPMSFAPIIDGKYRVAVRGGAVVGAARVEIFGYRPDPNYKVPPVDQEGPGIGGPRRVEPPKTQFLPAKYNSQSELETTIEGGSGEITRDFTLTD
ncbi:MAG: hypothetical protein KKA28_16015 [Planctomycetes bacterium]|nr:hypothetical protein [Planctomycetota bacterium]MCG2685142.1 hypothetical protein [Planctomycetales bacterium]